MSELEYFLVSVGGVLALVLLALVFALAV